MQADGHGISIRRGAQKGWLAARLAESAGKLTQNTCRILMESGDRSVPGPPASSRDIAEFVGEFLNSGLGPLASKWCPGKDSNLHDLAATGT
jgi:hypothetical protein